MPKSKEIIESNDDLSEDEVNNKMIASINRWILKNLLSRRRRLKKSQ